MMLPCAVPADTENESQPQACPLPASTYPACVVLGKTTTCSGALAAVLAVLVTIRDNVAAYPAALLPVGQGADKCTTAEHVAAAAFAALATATLPSTGASVLADAPAAVLADAPGADGAAGGA